MDKNFIEEEKYLNYALQRIDDKVDYLSCNKPYPNVSKYSVAHGREEVEDMQYKKACNANIDNQIAVFNSFKENPYFARMDFEYIKGGYDEKTEKIYIGKKSLIIDYDQLVYDWRSPIGQYYYMKNVIIFRHENYNYSLLLRRGLDIKKGKLINYYDEYVFGEEIFSKGITDPFLIKALRDKRFEHRITDIIKSIQENQNTIIRHPFADSFIVQGCAGSGKTMILLHRLSYLIFNNKNLNSDNIKIITPNENFNININELSNELGLDNIERLTATDYYVRLINKYDKRFLKNAEISLNESILDSKFLMKIYSDDFYNKAEDIYIIFINNFFDQQTLNHLKNICVMKHFNFATDGNISDNYKLENYKSKINNLLEENVKRKRELSGLKVKLTINIKKIEDFKLPGTNELALQEQIEHIEFELDTFIKDIEPNIINLKNTHKIEYNFDINIQEIYNLVNTILSNYKKLSDKYNKIEEDIDNYNVKIANNTIAIDLIAEKIILEKDQLEIVKKEFDDTAFYNLLKRRKIVKSIKIFEANIYNNKMEHSNLLKKKSLLSEDLHLRTTEATHIHYKLLTEEEFNTINKYNDILMQYKMNLEGFKQKLYEIQLEKEIELKKMISNIESLEFEVIKIKQSILDDDEKSIFEKYQEKIGQITPEEIYNYTIDKALLQMKQEYNIEKSNLLYKFDLYLQLLFCVLFYRRVRNYDTFLNIDEGQDLSSTEFKLFNLANGGNVIFNIYGDLNQRISAKGIVSWDEVELAKNNFVLNENYRNTKEITDYCNKILYMTALPIGVTGKKVIKKTITEVIKDIKNKVINTGKDRNAIIIDSKNSNELLNVFLKVGCINNRIVPGKISVFTVEQSKGLEHDCVYVYDRYMTKNEKYISYTRALKELIIF